MILIFIIFLFQNSSAPGEIIIKQEQNTLPPPAPPLVIRQQPVRPETPEPMVIREYPPKEPARIGQKLITISGKRLPPPPRKVVIERYFKAYLLFLLPEDSVGIWCYLSFLIFFFDGSPWYQMQPKKIWKIFWPQKRGFSTGLNTQKKFF